MALSINALGRTTTALPDAAMFEATSSLGDWEGDSKLKPTVEVLESDGNTMRFKVKPGDGTAPSAFLRIRR